MKFIRLIKVFAQVVSHPARGAWIEIERDVLRIVVDNVAPRKGCVD